MAYRGAIYADAKNATPLVRNPSVPPELYLYLSYYAAGIKGITVHRCFLRENSRRAQDATGFKHKAGTGARLISEKCVALLKTNTAEDYKDIERRGRKPSPVRRVKEEREREREIIDEILNRNRGLHHSRPPCSRYSPIIGAAN